MYTTLSSFLIPCHPALLSFPSSPTLISAGSHFLTKGTFIMSVSFRGAG